MPARLRASTDIPSGTGIDATVYEDQDGDGQAEAQQTVSLDDGKNTYELTGVDNQPQSQWWVRVELQTTDEEVTPRILPGSIELSVAELYERTATTHVDTINASSDGLDAFLRTARVHSDPVTVFSITNPQFRTANVNTGTISADAGSRLVVGIVDTSGIVMPQDEGTGLEEGMADWMSAGHFAGMLSADHNNDYVERGLEITPNWEDGTFTLGEGLAFFEFPENEIKVQGIDSDGEYDTDWPFGSTFAVAVDQTDDISFVQNGDTDVWLTLDMNEPNSIRIEPQGAGDLSPDPPNLLVARISSEEQEVKDMNRGRHVFKELTSDPNDVDAGEVWYRTDLQEFRAALDEQLIVSFDVTEV